MTLNGVLLAGTPIAIDYWRERHCSHSKLFFLSHYHADHMEGLNSSWSFKIYCSQLTAGLLVDEMKIQNDLVTPLEVGQPHIIPVDELGCETMTVTLLDANHCPGSVMFVFEGYFGCIFYTGDFRYDDQLSLQPGFPQAKQVDQLFIDNTYCNPKAQFPTRKQALEIILKIIKRHPGSTIVIGMMHIGKEELLEELAIELKTMIVVDSKRLQRLQLLQRLNVFTDRLDMGRIIVKYRNEVTDAAIERWNQQFGPTIAIIPTALYIYQDRPPVLDKRIHVVHYSDHSNYNELRQFVNIVKPCHIIPIVNHIPDTVLGQSWNDMKCFDDLRHPSQPLTVTVPISVTQFMYGFHQAGELSRNLIKVGNTSKRKNTTSGSRKKLKHGGIVYESSLEENQSSTPATDDTTSSAVATIQGKQAKQVQQIETVAEMSKEDDIALDFALHDQGDTVIETTPPPPGDGVIDCPDSTTRDQEETESCKNYGSNSNMTTMVLTTTKASPLDDRDDVVSNSSGEYPHDIANSQESLKSSENISSNNNNNMIATLLSTRETSSPASNVNVDESVSDDNSQLITNTPKNIKSFSNDNTVTTSSSMTKASVHDNGDGDDINTGSNKPPTNIANNLLNVESLENDSIQSVKNTTVVLFPDADTIENVHESPKHEHPSDINTTKVSQLDSNNVQIETLSQQSSNYIVIEYLILIMLTTITLIRLN